MSIPIGYYKNVYFSPKVYIFCFCGQKGSLQLNIKNLFSKTQAKIFPKCLVRVNTQHDLQCVKNLIKIIIGQTKIGKKSYKSKDIEPSLLASQIRFYLLCIYFLYILNINFVQMNNKLVFLHNEKNLSYVSCFLLHTSI